MKAPGTEGRFRFLRLCEWPKTCQRSAYGKLSGIFGLTVFLRRLQLSYLSMREHDVIPSFEALPRKCPILHTFTFGRLK